MGQYFKLARPDGFDFYTGNTINYRDSIGLTVKSPSARPDGLLCTDAVLHASDEPNKCFIGKTTIPCSAYMVEGTPVDGDKRKCGFAELLVVEEVTELDAMFGWMYSEVTQPINPLLLTERMPLENAIELINVRDSVRDSVRASVWASVWDSAWASVGDSVGASVGDSVRASVWASVWDSVGASVRASVRDSVGDSVGDSVWDSVGDSVGDSVWDSVGDSAWASVGAYIGSLFPNIEKWRYVEHEVGVYPYQSCCDLWRGGYVPSHDGNTWRLHAGEKAEIVYEMGVTNR